MVSNEEMPNGTLEGQVEDLLSLVLARTRGEVGNDAVENALDDLVANHTSRSSGGAKDKTTGRTRRKQSNKDIIIPDEDNYDDDSEDDTKMISATTSSNKTKPTSKKVANKKNKREREEALENIPLGKMGERMLITFGDGPYPNLEVISTALLGTRASLQRSILDARALRRKLKDNWHQARAAATMHRGTYASNYEMKKTTSGVNGSYAVVDSELSFRALDGNGDGIRYDVSCGFDVPQLETLFPEEMNAYQRWKKMHDAYSDKSGEVEVPKKSEEYLTSDNNKEDELESDNTKIISGRFVERLANFDARTNEMGEDWYMKFADVRKGSFLPRAGGRSSKTNVETDEWKDRGKKRGRPTTKARTSWQKLSPTSVIFLHWIGFDPISALSPPNEETTHALGYLAYDFFGKIVEKAVSLRLESDKKSGDKKQKSRSDGPLLELTGGDQLEKEDIEQAMSEVNLNSLYSSSNVDLGQSAKVTQLYFGAGFEDRLELEMDELFGSKEKTLSSEEMKVRKEEEDLFSSLPAVPTLLSSVSTTLQEISTPEENDTKEPASTAKKPRRALV